MNVYLVRHAKAGSRHRWEGDDVERPLSGGGRAQAEALAERLADVGITSLWSSPFRRCVETLEPLAKLIGHPVTPDRRLAEGASIADALALLAEAGPGSVHCSHGDVVPEVIAALARRGMALATEPDWRKATLWVLTGDGASFTSASVEPPLR